jgi:hypothetical protein
MLGGQALTQEPMPVPPPVQRPEALPRPPEVQTFAVCGAGTTCDCENVVSVAQARDGQSCTVTSSTGSCTFQSRGDDVGGVVSAGREHERSGESRPRLIVRSRPNGRALWAGKSPRVEPHAPRESRLGRRKRPSGRPHSSGPTSCWKPDGIASCWRLPTVGVRGSMPHLCGRARRRGQRSRRM